MKRRASSLVLWLIALTIAAAAASQSLKKQPPRIDVTSALAWADVVSAPQADAPPALERTNWPRVNERGPYFTFEALRKDLVHNTITPSAIEGFAFIIDDEKAIDRIEHHLTQLESADRVAVVPLLYQELMSAPSNRDIMLQRLEMEIEHAFGNATEDPDNTGRFLGWDLSINNHAAFIAFQRTGDLRFLDLLVRTFDRMLALRDSERGIEDEYHGGVWPCWSATRYDKEDRHVNFITLSGRIFFPMLQFAEAVRHDPGLRGRYGADADRYVEAARSCIDMFHQDFRVIENGREGYYIFAGRGDVEPLNHMAWAGNTLILLHELTGESTYGIMAEQMARFFRSAMWIDHHGALVWTYWPTPEQRASEDLEWVWKSRTTMQFIIFAHEHGVVFTDEDMHALGRTFTRNINRGGGRYSTRIDHEFENMENRKDFRGGYLCITPYIVLENVDPQIPEIIEDLLAERPDIGGWLKGNHGIIAYAWRLGDGRAATASAAGE